MEFRRFLHADRFVARTDRAHRQGAPGLSTASEYNRWLKDLFAGWEHLRRLRAT